MKSDLTTLLIRTNKFKVLFAGILSFFCFTASFGSTTISKISIKDFTDEMQQQVTGTVTDADGQPLPGANVLEKGTINGTQTDFDGNFAITVSNDAILEISYVGFTAKDIKITGQTNLTVVLDEDAQNLDEVVVVGFGTQKSSKVVASVAAVTNEELKLEQRPAPNIVSALQGSVPGLIISNASGAPGSTPNFQIRGNTTFNNAPVLVIIDNFEGNLQDIDPQTVESVTVLKDASAVAVYGARGANGVLLVTTKNASKDKKVSITYNYSSALQAKPQLPNTLTSLEYLEFQNSIIPGTWGEETLDLAREGFFPDTVWPDELYEETAFQQSHNVSITGGSKNTGYLLTTSFLSQDGLIVGDDNFRRLNLRLKIDTDVTDWLSIGTNTLISNTVNFSVPVTTGPSVRGLPLFPVTSPDGFFVSNGTTDDRGNVVAQANSGSFNRNETDRVNLQLYAQLKPFKGLVLEQRVSYIKRNTFNRNFNNDFDIVIFDALDPDTFTNPNAPGNQNFLSASPESRELILTSLTSRQVRTLTSLKYDHEVGKHSTSVFLGFQAETGEGDTFSTGRRNFLFDNIIALNQGSELSNDNSLDNGFGNTETRFGNARTLSYFGRVNYSYADKYLVEASFRADGSSFFTENNQFGYFPAIALGWVASKENFLKDVSYIDQLKFRASYGQTGDDSGLGAVTQQLVNFNAFGAPIGGVLAPRLNLPNLVNPDLIFETSTILNLGIDASLFRGKLQFQADYFNNKRSDILFAITTTAFEFGFGDAQGNPFAVDSEGFELNVNHKNKIGAVNYSIAANIAYNDNEITQLTPDAIGPNFQVGQSINDRFGFETDGFFDSQEEIDANVAADGTPIVQTGVGGTRVGGYKYVDQLTVDTDGDGVFDARDGIINNDDRVILERNSAPNYIFGSQMSVGYKGLSVSARFSGTFQNTQQLNGDVASQPFLGGGVPFSYQLDVYSPTNTNALFPTPTNLDPVQLFNTNVDRLIIDAAYVKLNNVTLNYNFSKKLLDKIGLVRSANFYVSAENVGVVWTNSPIFDEGFDPELGVNAIRFPLPFTTSVGLNLKF